MDTYNILLKNSNLGIASVILLFLMTFSSCDYYDSPYPISEKGEREINKEILGRWVKMRQKEKKDSLDLPESELSIYLWDGFNFLVTEKKFEDKSIKISDVEEPRRIWNSFIDSFEFINCHYLGQENVYHIYQYQIKDDSLKIKYLTDSLKLVAQSREEFHNYITNNLDTFLTCFSNPLSYIRWEAVLWTIVNPLEIKNISKINLLPENMTAISQDSLGKLNDEAFSKFELCTISELFAESHTLIKNVDSLILDFQNYHLALDNFEGATPDQEEIPKIEFFILENENGHFTKLWMAEEVLWDLTNDLVYLKVPKSKI